MPRIAAESEQKMFIKKKYFVTTFEDGHRVVGQVEWFDFYLDQDGRRYHYTRHPQVVYTPAQTARLVRHLSRRGVAVPPKVVEALAFNKGVIYAHWQDELSGWWVVN